jgi:hypothetical protein
MNKFVLNNWFQLMLGSSLMMGSGGFLIHASATANAAPEGPKESLPKNQDGTITVRLAPDQLNELQISLTAIQKNTEMKITQESGVVDVAIVGYRRNLGSSLITEGGIPVEVNNWAR